MSLLRGLLGDKERKGEPSTGRAVAILAAISIFGFCLPVLAVKALDISAAWAFIAVATLFAVPIQKALASTKHGPELLKSLFSALARLGRGKGSTDEQETNTIADTESAGQALELETPYPEEGI